MKLAALVLVTCLSLVSAARAVSWERPLRGPVLRPFALSADRYARGQHRGVDLAAPLGSTVRAACGGRVRFAGSVPGGGRTVSVACGVLAASYQHLGAVAVRQGQVLATGAAIGTVGRSGDPRDPRPHLHLGARELASGRYVDPMALFGPAQRATPPVGLAPRRPEPLGPAPDPVVRRPAALRRPLGPAPEQLARRPAPSPDPLAPVPDRREAPVAPLPLAVWIGLAAFGLGLPLGGLVTRGRRRRRTAPATARSRRWAAAHR